MRNLTELNKLESYLKEKGIEYERFDREAPEWEYDRHQIIVYRNGERIWDAICQKGSYGAEDGLLEILADFAKSEDKVEGWLTADEVIKRLR